MRKLFLALTLLLPLSVHADLRVGRQYRIQTISADYTISPKDDLINVTAGSTLRTQTLPDATKIAGKSIVVVKVDSGTGFVKLQPVLGQTISGLSSLTLIDNAESAELISNGTNWITTAPLERFRRVKVGGGTQCASTPCNIASQSGTWVSSITRASQGNYDVLLNTGIFSATPNCAMSWTNNAGSGVTSCRIQYTSSTDISVSCYPITGANSDVSFDMNCTGAR